MDVFNTFHASESRRAGQPPERVGTQVSGLEQRLTEIESRFSRLALVTHSLWELLKDRHGYTEDELRDWVNLTDLQDGQLDGRVRQTKEPLKCHKCDRVVTRAFGRCMYCGEFAASGDAFDRVH